jgi:hypothetical protein
VSSAAAQSNLLDTDVTLAVENDLKEEYMPSIVINAPRSQVEENDKKSFDNTFKTGVGDGYAINRNLFSQIYPGCKVVLLSKDQKVRAEGELVRLVPSFKTGNGIQRYDVYVKDFKRVPYVPERLNRNGVAVII